MAQAVLNKSFKVDAAGENAITLVEKIKNFISKNDCPNLSMDISHLNIMEASKVTVLCSTYHWTKYPEGKINWLINSNEINELINPLNLGNISLITPQ